MKTKNLHIKSLLHSNIFTASLVCALFFLQSCASPNKALNQAVETKSKTEANIIHPSQPIATPNDVNYVYDYEDVFSAPEEKKLDTLVRNFEKSNLIPIKIVTVKDSSITIENFDQSNKAVLDEWALSHGNSERCMAISISKNLRRIRIDYGPLVLRQLSDAEASAIIENQFKPSFKAAQYYDGTLNGLNALMDAIRKNIKF